MELPQKLHEIQPLTRTHFERIRDSEFRPSFDLIGLKYLRDKAGNEQKLRELYERRAPYELLQNADDARAEKVAFILSSEGLAFAHDGHWFTVANFRSLADGWSDKDPNQCIGHKGLGFRSVLDITPSPYLVKVDAKEFFAVKFSWALNNGHIQESLRRKPSLRDRYEEWRRYGQTVCPVMAIPGLATKQNLGAGSSILQRLIREMYGGQFTTMFWFPANDADIEPGVLQELRPRSITADPHGQQVLLEFIGSEVSVLLPFLASIEEVTVYENDRRIGLVRRSVAPEEQGEQEVTIHTELNGRRRSDSFFQMPFSFPIPSSIVDQADTPRAVKSMREKGARIVLSVRLLDGQPAADDKSRFHVYFPTAEGTGLGFVVHGDFYVKPDRTRLMVDSHYNDWLLSCAARRAANEFLTQLLERYRPRSVFGALSPVATTATEAAGKFVRLFSKELQERREPFIPTSVGLLSREQVLLPPAIDGDGFWETHFSDVVDRVVDGKRAFLDYEEDGRETRAFLRLAQAQLLEPESVVDFVEEASQQKKPANWWYECFEYIAQYEKLSRYDRSFFVGRKTIPATDSTVIAVPDDHGLVICLPPADDNSGLDVPDCFSRIFVFIDPELADLLDGGEDTVRSWVLNRFRIMRFEATDLLPRAVRGVVQQLFTGEFKMSPSQLRLAWMFIKKMVDASRTILSSEFWEDIGRFPLPIDSPEAKEILEQESFVPAFLAYWPDGYIEGDSPLRGVEGLRRIDEGFLNALIQESKASHSDWIRFFAKTGVSATLKLLKYSRIVGEQDVQLVSGGPNGIGERCFSGERQSDENKAVIERLREENLWDNTVESASPCGHGLPTVIQSLTVVEGLSHCTQMAEHEYQSPDVNWSQRLWSLIRDLPVSSVARLNDDTGFCRGGGPGGHSIPIGSCVRRQLGLHRWLPSSQGPANSSECFLRFTTRRLISSGRTDEDLGDILLPYVIVESIDDLAHLQGLGVEVLDDAPSASSSALVRALALLGERLSTEWGRKEIVELRSRWRLVRGAIQEIYRSLNQSQSTFNLPPSIKFATRSVGNIEFRSSPLYYAEPGSAIERAFLGMLPLLDVDRPQLRLFEQIGVIRLVPGQTVNENFLAERTSVPSVRLCDQIVNDLGPFLLAPIIARSEKSKQGESILRRLRERFEVKVARNLTVSFSLMGSPSAERTIDFPNFYLQRRLISGQGAIQEAHHTLYVAGKDSVSLFDPDFDADALGEALVPVFMDGISDELVSLFPRITSRYHHFRGKPGAMEEFMHNQLGISKEAQDFARAMVAGETVDMESIAPLAPPPAKIIISPPTDARKSLVDKQGMEEKLRSHEDRLKNKAASLVQALRATSSQKGGQSPSPVDHPGFSPPVGRFDEISAEQEDRGRRGEEEIKRRLQFPGGWQGFILLTDKRDLGCGYDFLCVMGGREVRLEVKTFTRNGRVVLSSRELQEAAASRGDYYLIGALDELKPEYEWSTFIIPNPIDFLLTKGDFDIQTKLQVSAEEVFRLYESQSG